MKLNKPLILGLIAGLVAVVSAGFWVLSKVEDASSWPIVQFKNLLMTSPDSANLKNLVFRESTGGLVVIDPSKRAEFGFLCDHKYYRASFDPSRHLGPDNSAHIVVVYEDGTVLADFPFQGPSLARMPDNARFQRVVRNPTH